MLNKQRFKHWLRAGLIALHVRIGKNRHRRPATSSSPRVATLDRTVPPPQASRVAASPAPTLDPRAHAIDLPSAMLGLTKRLYVYTPPHYDQNSARLPVLYLFRGHEREWINPQEDASRVGRTVIDVYEGLLTDGDVGPMILVFPGVASPDNRWSGMLVNARQPDLPIINGELGTGRWEDYFLQELVPYIDGHYRTNPHARAVDGFSLGGFMSVKIAVQHPELFRSVGAYDGLYFYDDPKNPNTILLTDNVFGRDLFDPIWGRIRDRQFAARNNPLNLVRLGDQAALSNLQWLIEYGPESAEPNDSNYYRGHRLRQLLFERGIPSIGGAITNAHHSWQQADEHMRRTLPLHWKRLHEKE